LKGYTLIEGFPGMGFVGSIVSKYLVEKLKLRQLGYIRSNAFMPIIRISKGMPVYPSRIFIDEKKKIVVLNSDQIIPKMFTEPMAKSVADWVDRKGIKKVIALSGIQATGNKGIVYGIAANNKSVELLERYNIKPIDEGMTTGITALILLYLKRKDIEAISVMGNVSIAADYKAAAELVKLLNKILNLDVDTEPLMEEAKKIESEVIKNLKKIKSTKDTVEKFESKTPMYT